MKIRQMLLDEQHQSPGKLSEPDSRMRDRAKILKTLGNVRISFISIAR